MNTDFSPAYLQRELRTMAASPRSTVFLGDSVLWGFGIRPEQTAVSILASRGCDCRNLSFKASSPPNYYALVRLMQQYGVRPKLVVLETDQRVLNEPNDAYAKLHPAIAQLAGPLLTPADRRTLAVEMPDGVADRFDRLASSLSLLYAMRADVRETFFPVPETLPIQHPTADMFYGEYDLRPLSERNVGVWYLEKAAETLRAAGIPVIAFMTPTNHELLHDYIDGPEYQANVAYLERVLEQHGARVLNLDRRFPGSDFFDNAHLRPAGQIRLAQILERAIRN